MYIDIQYSKGLWSGLRKNLYVRGFTLQPGGVEYRNQSILVPSLVPTEVGVSEEEHHRFPFGSRRKY